MALKSSGKKRTQGIKNSARYLADVVLTAIVVCCSIFLFIGYLDFLTLHAFFQKETTLQGDILPYVLAEEHTTSFPGRTWVNLTIKIIREEYVTPYIAAEDVAVIASVYADVLDQTHDSKEASQATATVLEALFPARNQEIAQTLVVLHVSKKTLSSPVQEIVRSYGSKIKDWQLQPPAKDQKELPHKVLSLWFEQTQEIPVPPPPEKWGDRLQLSKLLIFLGKKVPDDEEIIFFWDGIESFYSRRPPSITQAGVWQNILFIETEKTSNDETYAFHQKVLAQGIADAFTLAKKTKYIWNKSRPLARIPNINPLISDPGDPGYVSEYAAAAAAAHTILSAAIPEKINIWNMHARNAINSRVLGGVNFDIDSKAGIDLGLNVGMIISKKYFGSAPTSSKTTLRSYTSSGFLQNAAFTFLELPGVRQLRDTIRPLYTKDRSPDPQFENASPQSGFDMHIDSGAAWGDFDNDNNLDLLLNNGLYRNMGDGTFEHVGAPTFLRAPAVFGDYNNDGCADVYAVRYGNRDTVSSLGDQDILYKNNCDGTFMDVTASTHMQDTFHGVSASWADFDNDGFLDLYVLNKGILLSDHLDDPNVPYQFEPNILYHNNHDGTFTNITSHASTDGILDCDIYRQDVNGYQRKMKVPFQPLWFDYDNDRFPDLFLVSDTFMSPLYHNNRDGTFTQVTKRAGLCTYERASNMGAGVGDFNHDGYLDLYVTNVGDNYLWKNNGDGTFTDVAKDVGANDQGYGWGAVFFDYDNDGHDDILVTNGNNRLRAQYIKVASLKKRNDLDELFRNNGNGTFTPVGLQEGLSNNDIKFTSAVADYDNNGFVDIFLPMNGWRHPGDTSILYRNKGNGNHWITIKLIGTKSNRDAIGAHIHLQSLAGTQLREVINGSSYVGQSSPWQTFGLGKNTKIDAITIAWPSGEIQKFDQNIPIDQMVVITENNGVIEHVPR